MNTHFWAFPSLPRTSRTGRAFPSNLFVLKKEAQKGFSVQSLTQNPSTSQKKTFINIKRLPTIELRL